MEKTMTSLTKISLMIALLLSTGLSLAKGVSASDPYVREVPPGQMNSATFLTLKNDTDKEIALIKASSDVAKHVELHEHVHLNGMMQMRQVHKIAIPAKGITALKPGGYHIMLIGLTRKIKSGDIVDLNLTFDDGSKQAIKATVKKVMQGMMGNMKGMKKGTMKMDKAHLNPMPNLMLVFKEMPEKLNLTAEQTKQLKAGIAERDPKVTDLYKAITQYEKDIFNATLADKPLSDIDQLATNLVQERLNLINVKAACAVSVKEVMGDAQFSTLQTLYKNNVYKKRQYADNPKEKMALIKHVNPLPDLMMVYKKMSDKLKLNDKQARALKQWNSERDPVLAKQYQTIIDLENQLQDAALNNAPSEKIAELADGIMQNRIKVIRGQVFNREKLQEILTPDQYKQAIKLYKEHFVM